MVEEEGLDLGEEFLGGWEGEWSGEEGGDVGFDVVGYDVGVDWVFGEVEGIGGVGVCEKVRVWDGRNGRKRYFVLIVVYCVYKDMGEIMVFDFYILFVGGYCGFYWGWSWVCFWKFRLWLWFEGGLLED